MKKALLPILGVFAIAATGCGGGGNGGAFAPAVTPGPTSGYPAPPPGSTTSPASEAGAVFKITVPSKTLSTASNVRRPEYISTATQSMSFNLTSVNGTAYSAQAPQTANLTPGSPNCVSNGGADTGLVCTVTFKSLPIGTDGFTVTTYSGTSGSGSALSSNKASATISVATITTVPLTLQGIINTLGVTVGLPALVQGTPSTHSVTIVGNDASGAQIIGSAPFNNGPIVVTTDDTLNAITGLSNLGDPSATESFSYSGTAIGNNVDHVIATVGAITSQAPIPVTVAAPALSLVGLPIDFSPTVLTGSGPYAITSGTDAVAVIKAVQSGWGSASGHPFTVTNTCGSSVVVTTSGTDQFTLTSGGTTPATCSVTINGGGASTTLNYSQSVGSNGAMVNVQSANAKH